MTLGTLRLRAEEKARAGTVPPPPATPIRWTRVALAVLVGFQAVLLAFILWLFGGRGLHEVMALEARPLIKTPSVVVSRRDVVDCLHCLSGAGEAVESSDPLIRQLMPDPGHFSWIVLDDRAAPGDGLLRLAQQASLTKQEMGRFRRSVTDGVVNFFYDTGGREDFFKHNWSVVGAAALQASPLLSWEKGIDFVVLASYGADHASGLPFIASLNPRLPVFAPPPHPDEGNAPAQAVRGLQRVVVLPLGLHRLSRRLSSYVYETRGRYVAALVVVGSHGPVLVSGCDDLPPHRLIPRVERILGRRLAGFVGATGYRMGTEDPALAAQLRALAATHAGFHMAPGYATSDTAQAMLRRLFGDAGYQAGLLGARIHL